jgi:hypothetical protein
MKRQDMPPDFSSTSRRGLALSVPTERHGSAQANGMKRFLAAMGDRREMGDFARWRVRQTVDEEGDGIEQ